MNFLHVIHRYYPYIGGSEQVMQELSERFAREGHRVSVYTTDAWDLEHFWASGKRRVETPAEIHNGVQIRRWPVERLPASPIVYPALRRVMALLGRFPRSTPLLLTLSRLTPRVPSLDRALDTLDAPVDLVHAANISLDSLVYAAYRLAQRRHIPLIITPFTHLGEPDDRRVRRFNTMPHQVELLRRADAVVVQTEIERQALVECGVPSSRMHCIGVGVNSAKVMGGDGMRWRAQHQVRGPMVLFIGAAAYDKGAMHLVTAMEKIWSKDTAGTGPTLVIAGPPLSPFQQFFAGRPVETRRRTCLLGFIPEQDKRDLLAACDVLVLPSRTESFGIVYLEAWLYNKPVIGARAGGVPAVISDGRDGLLVKFGDTEDLAARIEQLLADHALAARLGRAGHTRVMNELTWDKKFEQVRSLYDQLTQRQ